MRTASQMVCDPDRRLGRLRDRRCPISPRQRRRQVLLPGQIHRVLCLRRAGPEHGTASRTRDRPAFFGRKDICLWLPRGKWKGTLALSSILPGTVHEMARSSRALSIRLRVQRTATILARTWELPSGGLVTASSGSIHGIQDCSLASLVVALGASDCEPPITLENALL